MDLKKFSFLAYFDLSKTEQENSDSYPFIKEPLFFQIFKNNSYIDYIKKFCNNSDNPFDYQLRGYSDKKFKTLFFTNISNLVESCITAWVFNQGREFLSFSNVNKDVLYNHMSKYLAERHDIRFGNLLPIFKKNQIKFLMDLYNVDRVLSLVFNIDNSGYSFDNFKDIIKESKALDYTLDELKKVLPKKPKSLSEIHDYFFNDHKIRAILREPDYDLNPREDLFKLNNSIIEVENQKLKVIIPKTRHELALFSKKHFFDNCVGSSFTYANNVLNQNSVIFGIFSEPERKPLYCIEAKKYSFKQARGVSNSDIPDNVVNQLQGLLTLKPELPSEFIEVSNSFIFGYKYNPDELKFYVMFRKNETIYEYNGVPFDVYEKFQTEKSKGSVLNSYVKKYPFEKLK